MAPNGPERRPMKPRPLVAPNKAAAGARAQGAHVELTDEQRNAVELRGAAVALSAGAGCGKTFVLTERFLAQLEPRADQRPRLSQLIAITFTERAAREMRNRIRNACTQRLLQCPDDQVDHWLGLVREMDSARISTIHSFCASLLRAHAVEAELDPQFRMLDQTQADTLLHGLIDERLRDRLAEHDESVIELVVPLSLKNLYEMIGTLLSRRQEIDWQRWRGETPERLAARWEECFREDVLPRMLRRIGESPAAGVLRGLTAAGFSRLGRKAQAPILVRYVMERAAIGRLLPMRISCSDASIRTISSAARCRLTF